MLEQNDLQQKSRLGIILINRGYITQEQLDTALKHQQHTNSRLGELLLEFNFIDKNQLARALRRQNWTRSIAATVALVLTPLSPVFAAGPGNTGTSSKTSAQINMTVVPKSITTGPASLLFNSRRGPSQVSDGLCTSNLGADIYRIKASGSGKKGQFVLSNPNYGELSYQVAYKHQNNQFEKLDMAKASRNFQNARPVNLCADSAANRLKVSLKNPQSVSSKSSYSGYLTVTIVPE
ncbi:hypothetical protein [Aliikangiella sp. IMCC44359]|uniref:hypothetical protein n=1 Tax=Aliikangiella sp. IMCC44359 TaxID=3459125 RepID=UPI00403A8EC7